MGLGVSRGFKHISCSLGQARVENRGEPHRAERTVDGNRRYRHDLDRSHAPKKRYGQGPGTSLLSP